MKNDGKVLIVEENPVVAQAIEQAGEQFRLGWDRASDGWEAIELLENEQYEAIVIDTDIPRHSGYGVLTYLREEVGEELDNVIVMTSCDCGEVRRKFSDRLRVVNRDEAFAELKRVVNAQD